jgi:hypothetical protein
MTARVTQHSLQEATARPRHVRARAARAREPAAARAGVLPARGAARPQPARAEGVTTSRVRTVLDHTNGVYGHTIWSHPRDFHASGRRQRGEIPRAGDRGRTGDLVLGKPTDSGHHTISAHRRPGKLRLSRRPRPRPMGSDGTQSGTTQVQRPSTGSSRWTVSSRAAAPSSSRIVSGQRGGRRRWWKWQMHRIQDRAH